jgi:hypothetical protein
MITSMIIVTLFVLLVYPAIIPINAPPVLKTFKDIFVAVLSLVVVLLIVLLLSEHNLVDAVESSEPPPECSLLCTLRC